MWIITAWQCISPEVTVKGFKKCCTSNPGNELMIVCCGMAVKMVGMLGV
jgi:hypothetical protein